MSHGPLQVPIFPRTDPRQDLDAHQTLLGRTGAAEGTTAPHGLRHPGSSPAPAALLQVMTFLSLDSFQRQTFVIYQARYKYFSKTWKGGGKVCTCPRIQTGSSCEQTVKPVLPESSRGVALQHKVIYYLSFNNPFQRDDAHCYIFALFRCSTLSLILLHLTVCSFLDDRHTESGSFLSPFDEGSDYMFYILYTVAFA